MANKQNDPYFDPFPTSLRKLMEKNPATGNPVTPNELAEVLGTTAQAISYYINGKRKPGFDNIVTLCKFFDVSADFLLFGIDTKNIDMHKETGLSNEAIEMLVNAHNTNNEANDIYELLNSILSDRAFYEFIEDVDFHAAQLKELQSLDITELEKRFPGVNMVGYSKWSLLKEIDSFILSQLKKRGYLEDYEL
ncbi:MAG: helix-turn-helix transcriptional regulator [Lachnospiraceae bacterium]|nr:helix-turn-helix transcriptional regulator [Lachnospiraceae bacterium]